MIMIRAIIFDFGGVVTNDIDPGILKDISSAFGLSLSDTENALSGLLERYQAGGINDDSFWQEFSHRAGKALPTGWKRLWINGYRRRSKINKDIDRLIRKLKSRQYMLAVVSNTIPPHAKYNRKHRRFSLFDVVILSSEVGTKKPDKRIYELALEKLDVRAESCIYIDDKKENLAPAEILGMHPIQYRNIRQLEHDLAAFGVNID